MRAAGVVPWRPPPTAGTVGERRPRPGVRVAGCALEQCLP